MSDPAYLRTFKEYLREGIQASDIGQVEAEMHGESDRAMAVLEGSSMESALENAIKTKMRDPLSPELASRLFGFSGPLGTFSAKIDLGHALAMFGPDTYHDMHIIRQLRNAFAHITKPIKFKTKEIAPMCSHLRIPDNEAIAQKIPLTFFTVEKFNATDPAHPRTRYMIACH